MGEAAEFRYHADTMKLLAVAPWFDVNAADRIVETESACGRLLPAALREWYTLSGAEEWLTLDDNACGVTPLADFLREFAHGRVEIEIYGPRRVNTGYQAFVRMDGTENPPVVVSGECEPVPFAEYIRSLAEYKASSQS